MLLLIEFLVMPLELNLIRFQGNFELRSYAHNLPGKITKH